MAQPPHLPPSIDDLCAMAEDALGEVPDWVLQQVEGVAIRVVDFPDDETLAALEAESPFDIMGLYHGVPFGERSVAESHQTVDLIYLYRRPILDYWCETGEDLRHVVTHVLIHEIGHHFGFSDDDMEALEAAADAENG